MTTPESRTISGLSSTINQLISSCSSVVYLGNKFVEEGLIDEQGKSNIITLGISNYDKADLLMTAAKAKIEQDPESFHRLIAIFKKSEPLVPLVKQLKQNYTIECAKYHQLRKGIIPPVSNLESTISPVSNLETTTLIAAVLFGLAIVVLTWIHVQDYITAVSTTVVVLILTCVLLPWTNMQHYIQNVCADMNVQSLLVTPEPAYFHPRQAELTNINLKFEALRKQNGTQQKTVVLYIVAPPAYGKTQLARHYAKKYFARNVRQYFFKSLVVAAVDASSESSLYNSYKSLADELKLPQEFDESYSLKEGLLVVARAIAAELKDRQQGWLLILDNLTLEVKRNINASKWFPQPGSEDWGKGYVLVTTQDGQLVEKTNDFVMEYHLNDGMSEQDAMSFIQRLTGKKDDTKARELVNKLHRLPLGISVAGLFIQESRPSYSYSDYIQDLEAEDTFQDLAEEELIQLESDSLAYNKETQMKALVIFIKQQAKDPNLYKTFVLLATCANSPVPMRLVERAVAKHKVKVYSVRKSVKKCSILDITSTKSLDEGGIEVVKVHQVTWRALKATFLSGDAQHRNLSSFVGLTQLSVTCSTVREWEEPGNEAYRNELLHKFANCVRDEYLDQGENGSSPILQHKYIMQPHLEAFLRIEVPTFELDTNERIQLHRALSLCYWFTQNFEEAQALMQESLKLSKQSPVQLAEHTIENALTLGIFYREEGRFAEAESILKEWLPIAEKLQGEQSVLVGRISVILGSVYRQMDMYEKSRQNLEHALAISEKINGSDYSSLADQLYALAVLMIDAGRPCDALEYANRAASMLSIASIRKTPGKLHLNMLTLKALGVTFQKLGHIEKAAELLEYSLELYIKVYSEKSPSYAHPCSYLSIIHHQLGNFTRSKEMADTVYKILCNGADVPVGPGLPWAMDRTAPVYIARGELQRAETLLKKANQSKTAVGAPLVMKDAHHLFSTGVLAVLQGRFEEGMENLLKIVSREDQTHLSGVHAHAQLALMEIYLELGEHKQWLDMVVKLKNMKVNQSMNLDMFSVTWSADPEAIHEYIHIGRTTYILVALLEMTYHHDYSPGKVSSLHLNGWKAYYQKDYVTAKTFLGQALQLQDQHYASDNLLTAETLILLSIVLYCQGREDEAVNYLHRAMEALRTQNAQHPLVGKAAYVAGFLYNSVQKYEMAVINLKEAQTVAEHIYQSSHPMITKVNNMIDSIFKCGNNEIQLCEDPIELHRDIQRRQDNLTRAPVLYPDSHH